MMNQIKQTNDTILVTGANSLLARTFIKRWPGTSLIAVDTDFDAPIAGATQIAGDLRDSVLLDELSNEVSAIVHLAPLVTSLTSKQETLAAVVQGTYQLATSFAEHGLSNRLVMAGTSDLFGSLWARYRVNEQWRPRPTPNSAQLFPYLAELTLREVTRVTDLSTICLRMGAITETHSSTVGQSDPKWLHVDDAMAAIDLALAAEHHGWAVYHIGALGKQAALSSALATEKLSYQPKYTISKVAPVAGMTPSTVSAEPIAPRPIRRVAVFGAGGPLGSAVASELAQDYVLHLSDLKPLDELCAAEPQSPGAPLPRPPQPPHTWQTVDVCDYDQVMAACDGVDAIINCSVVRYGTDAAFGVNMVGAYNVMLAAVAHGIQRVVHTGPFMLGDRDAFGYDWDHRVVDDVPPRPGIDWVYIPSKMVGQEICRIYADHHQLSVPVLAFCQFVSLRGGRPKRISPLSVTWEDAGRAIRAALTVAEMPNPYEYFHIGTPLPHDVFSVDKARQILNWQAEDSLAPFYLRD